MNFNHLEMHAQQRTAQLQREAAVAAIVRATGAPDVAHGVAAALRRVAERLDRGHTNRPNFDIADPTVSLARRAA